MHSCYGSYNLLIQTLFFAVMTIALLKLPQCLWWWAHFHLHLILHAQFQLHMRHERCLCISVLQGLCVCLVGRKFMCNTTLELFSLPWLDSSIFDLKWNNIYDNECHGCSHPQWLNNAHIGVFSHPENQTEGLQDLKLKVKNLTNHHQQRD